MTKHVVNKRKMKRSRIKATPSAGKKFTGQTNVDKVRDDVQNLEWDHEIVSWTATSLDIRLTGRVQPIVSAVVSDDVKAPPPDGGTLTITLSDNSQPAPPATPPLPVTYVNDDSDNP
jgi:hypothetical protein